MAPNRWLATVYVVIAILALGLTWSQNLAYFVPGVAAMSFLTDAAVNPAARSITFDIALVLYAAAIWMVFEGRRRRMAFVWAYVIGGLFVAISVTLPLFLAARELKPQVSPDIPGRPNLLDGVGLGILTVLVAAICAFALTAG